jgi:hypothetical protein
VQMNSVAAVVDFKSIPWLHFTVRRASLSCQMPSYEDVVLSVGQSQSFNALQSHPLDINQQSTEYVYNLHCDG